MDGSLFENVFFLRGLVECEKWKVTFSRSKFIKQNSIQETNANPKIIISFSVDQ